MKIFFILSSFVGLIINTRKNFALEIGHKERAQREDRRKNMEWVEFLCKCKKDGTLYRRLVRRSSIRDVVYNAELDEVYLIFDVRKILFWRKRQYLIVGESFEEVKKKLLPLQKQR